MLLLNVTGKTVAAGHMDVVVPIVGVEVVFEKVKTQNFVLMKMCNMW